MNTTINNGWSALTVCMLLAFSMLLPNNLVAQSDIANKDRSSLIVELDLKRMMTSPLVDKEQLGQLQQMGILPFDVTNANRVFATVQFPDDFIKLTVPRGKALPFNFLMQVDFADAESAKNMIEPLRDIGVTEVEKNGKTFLAPKGEDAPENLLFHAGKEKSVEMGTEDYITKNSRDFPTKKLASLWSKNAKPNAIRLSIDVESNRKFVTQAMEVARERVPPTMQGLLGAVDHLATISLSADFDNANLLSIVATGKDEESTKTLNAAINGLLGMGRLMGNQSLSAGNMDEESKNTVKQLLDSLMTKVSGNEVRVTVPKPAGFDAMIKKLQSGG